MPRPVWTCRGVRSWFQRGCRRSRWGPGRIRPSRRRKRDRARADLDLRWTIEDDVDLFLGAARCEAALAPAGASAQDHHGDMDREARQHAASRQSPGCFEHARSGFHGRHQATTSIGRDKFDLQILDARLREIDDAQNSFVVQTVVGGQEQHALVPWAGRPGSPPRARTIRPQGSLDRPESRDSSPGAPPLPAARGWGTPGPMLRISCDSSACAGSHRRTLEGCRRRSPA